MDNEIKDALIKLIEVTKDLIDELGYQGYGGKIVREYYIVEEKLFKLAPELFKNR